MQKTIEEVLQFLRDYNMWRRGEIEKMPEAREIGVCIDFACDVLENVIKIKQDSAK